MALTFLTKNTLLLSSIMISYFKKAKKKPDLTRKYEETETVQYYMHIKIKRSVI